MCAVTVIYFSSHGWVVIFLYEKLSSYVILKVIESKVIFSRHTDTIQAVMGGQMRYGHVETSRQRINRKMDPKRMFAIWRIPPPWKPITKRPLGSRMGGGKGAIHHYTTPIKANRIILEMGGECSLTIINIL